MLNTLTKPILKPLVSPMFSGSAAILSDYAANGSNPQVVADFVNETYFQDAKSSSFGRLLTYAGASKSWMWNAQGHLVEVASGTPRIGNHVYNGSAWVNRGLLLESEARTNLCLDNLDPSTGNWAVTSAADAGGQNIVGLDGQANTGWTLTDDNASGYKFIRQAFTVADDSEDHTAQIWVAKDNDETRFPEARVQFTGGTTSNHYFRINSKTGASSVVSGSGTYEVIDWGNWWIIRMTCANNGTGNTTMTVTFYPAISGVLVGVADPSTTGSCGYGGMQVEKASTPSSYIPTTGSTVTRAAQTLTIAAANMPSYTTELSFAIKGTTTFADTDQVIEVEFFRWLDSVNDYLRSIIATSGADTGRYRSQQGASGVTDTVASAADYFTAGVNQPFSVASWHTGSGINAALDGTALTENSAPTALADLSSIDLQIGRVLMGNVTEFVGWNSKIADAGTEEASA